MTEIVIFPAEVDVKISHVTVNRSVKETLAGTPETVTEALPPVP